MTGACETVGWLLSVRRSRPAWVPSHVLRRVPLVPQGHLHPSCYQRNWSFLFRCGGVILHITAHFAGFRRATCKTASFENRRADTAWLWTNVLLASFMVTSLTESSLARIRSSGSGIVLNWLAPALSRVLTSVRRVRTASARLSMELMVQTVHFVAAISWWRFPNASSVLRYC